MYQENKTAQMAAYFLMRGGGRMAPTKLMKLLYLADRASVRRYGESISEDQAVSMPRGPVLSTALDRMNGTLPSKKGGWGDWVSPKKHYRVSLVRKVVNLDMLDELSPVDVDILKSAWKKFGGMSGRELSDWTHEHCKEWTPHNGSTSPITFAAICRAVGHTKAATEACVEEAEISDAMDRVFAGQ